MKTFSKPHAFGLLLFLLSVAGTLKVQAQATVSYPFAVGRNASCGSPTGSAGEVHYYTYNGSTNTVANAAGGLVGPCIPQLRIGGNVWGAQKFTDDYSSISYNPKDHNVYYFWTAVPGKDSAYLIPGGVPRTYAWRWPVGTCAGTAAVKLDTLRSFAADILGVAFDNSGNGYIIEFTDALPTVPLTYKPMLRSINFTTGIMGAADTLALTGGAKIYKQGSGDVAMSPSGQMFFVVDNKFFTPNYQSYTGTGANLTCTYVDTVKLTGNFVGLTYAEGETIAAFSGGGCPYYEINPLTAATSAVTKNNTPTAVYSAADMASVISGIGAAKNLVSVTATGIPKQYTVVYDIYIKNYGNYDLSNVQVTDDLTAINGAANLSAFVSTSFISNPAGLTLNTFFNGNSNKNLLNGTGTLPNYPVANNSAIIRVTCTVSNINQGTVYNNSATATGIGFNSAAVSDVSTNGTTADLNGNDKPDDAGESQVTPFLIAVTSQTPPCASLSTVLYSQTFGSGTTNTTAMPTATPGSLAASTSYTPNTTQPLAVEQYMLTNNANTADNARFNTLTDHTPAATNGRMLVINADVKSTVMYQGTVSTLCPNQQYSLIFYAAFIDNPSYQTVCNGFGGSQFPRIKMRVRDVATGLVITQISTTDITSASWTQYGLKFIMPSGYSSVYFELINDAPGGCGNDVALDDIQFGLCTPVPTVTFSTSSSGCIGGNTTFSASLSDPAAVSSPVYQWQLSTDNTTFTNIGGQTAATYTINPLTTTNVNKYYRVIVASSGNMGTASCQYISPSFYLTAKTTSTAPTLVTKSKIACPGEAVSLKASGATLGSGAVYKWYTGSCGGTLVGTGAIITVSPTVSTTYYVRVEGDCNTSTCITTTVTFACDIDKDKDGITDVAESGGLDPAADDDFDGILNYRDADFAGFVDSNGDGVNDNFDADKDGVPNYLDLDSDNDGIPDVVESDGVDTNGDGKIDNYSDTDGDGLSQNVDANNTGYTGSGTGLGIPDLDGDGIPNFLDLDSDNDGIPDVREAGGTDANNDGMIDGYTDTDGDGFSQNVDGDTDNNGVAESAANALLRTGTDTNNNGRADSYPYKNMDADSKANPYDLDSDGDGISDVREAGFADTDFNSKIDGAYNARGWSTTVSALTSLTLPNSDTDPTGKTYPNYLDIDSDNDGIPDNIEGQLTNSYKLPSYVDTDGDGLDDTYDNFNGFGGNGINPVNTDGDSSPDYIDSDSDGDGLSDRIEGNDFNLNNKPDDNVTLLNTDTDGDGLDDRFDTDNSTAHGTSAYMGTNGSFSGAVTPGSRTMVQKSISSSVDRDWRDVGFVLELRFIDLNAALNHDMATVNWTVSSDESITTYIVERSTGTGFEPAKMFARKGAGSAVTKYTFTDSSYRVNTATVYYRIKAVTQAGKIQYSNTLQVGRHEEQALFVFPNPASSMLRISLDVHARDLATFAIRTMEGRQVALFTKYVTTGYNTLLYSDIGKLTNGVYFLQVDCGGQKQNVRFVVQH